MIKGITVSPGIATGYAKLVVNKFELKNVMRYSLKPAEIDSEIARLKRVIEETKREIDDLRAYTEKHIGKAEASVFGNHLMMIDDASFTEAILKRIHNFRENAEFSLYKIVEDIRRRFLSIDDELFRARADDIWDIGKRIYKKLVKKDIREEIFTGDNIIIVADVLLPSDIVKIDKKRVKGIVCEEGSKTSHFSIMIGSLGIPAMVGVKGVLSRVKPDDLIIVDANTSIVYVKPSDEVIKEYERRRESYKKRESTKFVYQTATTLDSVSINVYANVGMLTDVEFAKKYNADGIGLYRTEFAYIVRGDLPVEEELFLLYKQVFQEMADKPVNIRILDIGGDKEIPYLAIKYGENPFMGLRSIRIFKYYPEILKTQLKAIYRASIYGNPRLLIPMVAGLEDIEFIKEMIEITKIELTREGQQSRDIPIGIMIEVPSSIMMFEVLVKEADFFSIGTNDLIQFLLAVDRGNPDINHLYEPFHPAVIEALSYVIKLSIENNKEISICGDMAINPIAVFMLVGLGIKGVSVDPIGIPVVRYVVSNINEADAKRVISYIKGLHKVSEIKDVLLNEIAKAGISHSLSAIWEFNL